MQSSNGYPASPNPADIGVVPFSVRGVAMPGGVKGGDVETILRYVAEQFHLHVERLHPGWCWTYNFRPNRNNPLQLSDHSSATAEDLNAPAHPNGAHGTFSAKQLRQIRMILAFCEGTVKWGGDYHNTKDEMHWGISDVTTRADVRRVARKIRALGKPSPLVVIKSLLLTKRAHPKAHDGIVVNTLVVRGKHNLDVLEVQRVLNRWYPHLALIEDGHFGPKTAVALVRAKRSLKVSGKITNPRTKRRVLRKLGFHVL